MPLELIDNNITLMMSKKLTSPFFFKQAITLITLNSTNQTKLVDYENGQTKFVDYEHGHGYPTFN